MGFCYHQPTRSTCRVCEELLKQDKNQPIVTTYEGRSSFSNGIPFHDWYNFVLGYTPSFPEYMLKRENITPKDVVLDPFVGSGTTQLVCKLNSITSIGIDANDFMVFAATQKLNWSIHSDKILILKGKILELFLKKCHAINWNDVCLIENIANHNRPQALDKRYISNKPLVKISFLRESISELNLDNEYYNFFMFAVSSILVPVSNVKYGPGFGIGRIKDDVDIVKIFDNKINTMVQDLTKVTLSQKNTKAITLLGDSRHLSELVAPNSVNLMITSPPYPGDHEYTKHSKLELIFNGYATDIQSFRTIKKRMIRGSTTNLYREDNDKITVEDIVEIKEITEEIDRRLLNDGATSGFEKLYTKLIWEYFGGMAYTLLECLKVLKPGGKIALLVSDSHAFKMVHIKTAELLKIVGEKVGFVNGEIILWQMKNSTSHKYQLRENILILQKPEHFLGF